MYIDTMQKLIYVHKHFKKVLSTFQPTNSDERLVYPKLLCYIKSKLSKDVNSCKECFKRSVENRKEKIMLFAVMAAMAANLVGSL